MLAEAAEKQNLEEAISWREQIARLRPKDPDSQLNLVSAALRFGKLDLARKALDQIPAKDRDRPAFHVVAGWLASAEGNFAEQEDQFGAAVKKEPKNDLYQFNLAALQIHSSDAQKKANARENLEREMIQQTLQRHSGKISSAAAELGISRPTLYELMEKLGITREPKAGD